MKKKHALFSAKEKSSCLARQLCSGECRPFHLNVEHESSGGVGTDGQKCMKCEREF
jgi:hypothetical protein